MSQRRSRRSQSSQSDDMIVEQQRDNSSPRSTIDDDDDDDAGMLFSSQIPELSQHIPTARKSEQDKLNSLPEAARDKAITDLTRLVLFKGLLCEPIDRLKCIKEANLPADRISSAAFTECNRRLQDAFDFELRRMPVWMENTLPEKYKDRYYLLNNASSEHHAKDLHSVHTVDSVEKGFLLLVLALAYCQGQPRTDGSRWILDRDLYALLCKVDANLPQAPPVERGKKRKGTSQRRLDDEDDDGVGLTPDVDALLQKFVHRDYLVTKKAVDLDWDHADDLEEQALCYTLGPRGAMEVGRKQIVYFCAEILDQEPDPTMLAELDQDDELAQEIMEERQG